ncbi:family 20 glycosylhydrolase [soil metagenome]
MIRISLLVLATLTAIGCASAQPHPPSDGLAVSWGVRDNLYEGGGRFLSELTLTNDAAGTLGQKDWALYFNFVRLIDGTTFPASLQITRIRGDFYEVRPTEHFDPPAPGESLAIPFVAAHWAIKESDAPTGFYFIIGDGDGQSPTTVIPDVRIEPFATVNHATRGPRDVIPVPTPASRFTDNPPHVDQPGEPAGRIIPTPIRLATGEGSWRLTRGAVIHYDAGLRNESRYLADALEPLLGSRLSAVATSSPGDITLRIRGSGNPEAYRLIVDGEAGVTIEASAEAGVLYGIQSLRALLPIEAYRAAQSELLVPVVAVEDAPRFGYRGMHLDVARNFQTVESVERLLEIMAFYKLNRFHFHLTDDEGWRLAIAGLPELTEVGARRGHTFDETSFMVPAYGSGPDPEALSGSGHYSREDYIRLLRYAHERHIQVIPEIDIPGHARAAVKAMEARHDRLMAEGQEAAAREFLLSDPEDESVYTSVQRWSDNVINVCQESTYHFLETVFDDLIAMYAEAGVPLTLVHVGGDEVPRGVWERSPVCAAMIERGEVADTAALWDYFLNRVIAMLDHRDLMTAGWEEVAVREEQAGSRRKTPNPAFLNRNVVPYVWNAVWGWGAEDLGYRLANAGYPVVLSNASNLYFDLAYDKDPQEPGYYWAGLLPTRTVFEFAPFHIFNTSTIDVMGNPVAPADFVERPRLTAEGRSNVLGIQGQLWTETVKSAERMEYMALPRLLALAERAWAAEPPWASIAEPEERTPQLNASWQAFARGLGSRELARLDYLLGGFNYRLPPPGAVIEDGYLHANVTYPGLTIRYTTDGSEPVATSPRYSAPVGVSGTVKLRTFDTRGRASRTATVQAP